LGLNAFLRVRKFKLRPILELPRIHSGNGDWLINRVEAQGQPIKTIMLN